MDQLTQVALPLIVRHAHDPNWLRKQLEKLGFRVVHRRLRDGTQQWRFSHPESPDHEVILAKFPPGVGLQSHTHEEEERFTFLSEGVFTRGNPGSERVGSASPGDTSVVAANVPHSWRSTDHDKPGLMVVEKYRTAA